MYNITTENGKELLIVPVPKDSFDFRTSYEDKYTSLWLKTPDREYESAYGKVNEEYNYYPALLETHRKDGAPNIKIIGPLSSITEEQCIPYVEGFFRHDDSQVFDCWKDYFGSGALTYSCKTRKDSFISLLKYAGIDTEQELLILEKI